MKKLKMDLKNVGEILTRDQLKMIQGGAGALYFCTCAGATGTSQSESYYCYHSGGYSFCEAQAIYKCTSQYAVCDPATYYA